MQQETWAAAALVGDSLCVRVQGALDLRADRGAEPAMQQLARMLAPHLREDNVLPVVFAGPDIMRFATVPAAPALALTPVPQDDPRMAVLGIEGLAQTRPADVLGAKSAQVAGFIATWPEWDGVLCLSGRHSTWVHISAGEVVSFQTYLTGEIFDLLVDHSVLRRALDGAGWNDTAFDEALSDAMSRPERVAAQLFSLHAGERLAGHDPATARARLTGMLMGMEMAAARPYWLGQNVAVIGEGDPMVRYQSALATQGVTAAGHDPVAMALRGVERAYATQQETSL